MSGGDEPCYTIVRKPKNFEASNEIQLKRRIEGQDLEKCQAAIEEVLQNLIDGEKFPTNLMMPVINRYQMNRFSKGHEGIKDKRIKKLLYILWECLPKRGPDGKFLDKMVMVCGAFDKDLKHPNQYVCGSVLRTLSKTREPEVIRELVHSIEKCLEWSHAYQRKNAVLAIAKIYKNFPDLNPTAPKLIADYLMKENDDECKRAALQALLEIDAEEAKPYLHSSNVQDIHCMNASIQLLFVELIQRIYKKGDESQEQIAILTSLIRQSSSPSVRYQAASTLMRFTRDPEAIKLVASCFIDICAKDSDNNVKLIALDSLIDLRRLNVAERVLRNSIMDILSILQSATDFELQEKILNLSLDLLSPLNINGMVLTIRQELSKNIADPERVKYRRLLVDTVDKINERFPSAIVESGTLNTLFELLVSNTVGEKTASRLILLFKKFMSNNSKYQADVVGKVQDCFNLARDCPLIHRGLLQLMGDFSDTKEQIEKSYQTIKDSLGELPIVATSTVEPGEPIPNHPPLRHYFLVQNKLGTCTVLSYALVKMASRYKKSGATKSEIDKMIARFMFVLASILNLGYSSLTDSEGNPINMHHDFAETMMLGLKILQHIATEDDDELMQQIVTENMKSQLELAVKIQDQDAFSSDSFKKTKKPIRFDDAFSIPLLASPDEDFDFGKKEDEDASHLPQMPDMFGEIPLTGTIDPIYAYCVFDVNHYDIGLKIHIESRAKTTLENVTLELVARGENTSNIIDRPDPIVLAPRGKACIATNIKVVSAENRRLFGNIIFDGGPSGAKEQIIVLDDISVNITDYIKPASISFDDFRDVWRDCEWENKVTVKTKFTNLKEYLMQLVASTNMRCVTSEMSLSGECSFLSANLYARSSFGEEALVNVSIEKETPQSVVTGSIKIRARSQGMALSLGEKINIAQSAASK